jgi:hypothetical protein
MKQRPVARGLVICPSQFTKNKLQKRMTLVIISVD